MDSETRHNESIGCSNHSENLDAIEQIIYYAVYIPGDVQVNVDPYKSIFKDKQQALDVVKMYKKARFKTFLFYHEAIDFATHGYGHHEVPESTNHPKEAAQPVGEKPVAFRGPKSQDLVKLRKAVENGDLTKVESIIWDNPRYLISSGDTPSILQEGSRYNALHVAAKSKNRNMAELILNTVSNIDFVTLLYGDDDNQDLHERSKILLDLYLNTPDKGLNETPLHFAVKYGAVDVVELLVSYPQCDRNVRNKFGKLPKQIICERCDITSYKMVFNKMTALLENAFYVPVLRSAHNCTPPIIGKPFDPATPPVLNDNPLQPHVEIHAYAGPMSKEAAEKFRRVWKTPPRSIKQKVHCRDLEKGLERVGRDLAIKNEVGWKEYWEFLDDFADFSSATGLKQLENFLASRLVPLSNDSSNTSSSLGSNNLSPMSDLCKDLEACRLSENNHKKHSHSAKTRNNDNLPKYINFIQNRMKPHICIDKMCEVFAHRITNDILHLLENEYTSTTYELLEINITQLENVMASFMADNRFSNFDYRMVHHRVGCLIVTKLKDFILLENEVNYMKKAFELWMENCGKEFDYFSSDDECVNYRQDVLNHNRKKHTPKNKQVTCLLQHIISAFIADRPNFNSPDKPSLEWSDGKPCECVWPDFPISKRSSYKSHTSRNFNKSPEDTVSRRLFQIDPELASSNNENNSEILNSKSVLDKSRESNAPAGDSDDSEYEVYYTAYNTPSQCRDDSDCEDLFEDSFMSEEDIFIEGCVPTKMDYAVYNAVIGAKEKLNPDVYPNAYKWYHAVNLYSEIEKESWGNASIGRCTVSTQNFATLTPSYYANTSADAHHSPSNALLQRRGNHVSPPTSPKIFKPNISFNM